MIKKKKIFMSLLMIINKLKMIENILYKNNFF